MTRLTAYTSYADAQAHFSLAKLWELFDGDRERLNIADEDCIDRHVEADRTAVIVIKAAGGEEVLSYRRDQRGTGRALPIGWSPRRLAGRPGRHQARAVARLLCRGVRRLAFMAPNTAA